MRQYNSTICNVNLTIIVVFAIILGVLSTYQAISQADIKPKNNYTQKIKVDTSDTASSVSSSVNTATDTVIPDRDVEFNLEVLSKIATIHAQGTVKPKKSGSVVLLVWVDSTGNPYCLAPQEESDPIFIKPAMEAVYQYAKKYKLKPAIRNGKPVDSRDNLVPIIFDMSIFESKE